MEFIKLKDTGMSTDQAVGLTDDEHCQIPEIAKQIKDGGKQVKEYGKNLDYRKLWWWLWGLKKYVLERFKTGQWGRILKY